MLTSQEKKCKKRGKKWSWFCLSLLSMEISSNHGMVRMKGSTGPPTKARCLSAASQEQCSAHSHLLWNAISPETEFGFYFLKSDNVKSLLCLPIPFWNVKTTFEIPLNCPIFGLFLTYHGLLNISVGVVCNFESSSLTTVFLFPERRPSLKGGPRPPCIVA